MYYRVLTTKSSTKLTTYLNGTFIKTDSNAHLTRCKYSLICFLSNNGTAGIKIPLFVELFPPRGDNCVGTSPCKMQQKLLTWLVSVWDIF